MFESGVICKGFVESFCGKCAYVNLDLIKQILGRLAPHILADSREM